MQNSIYILRGILYLCLCHSTCLFLHTYIYKNVSYLLYYTYICTTIVGNAKEGQAAACQSLAST